MSLQKIRSTLLKARGGRDVKAREDAGETGSSKMSPGRGINILPMNMLHSSV